MDYADGLHATEAKIDLMAETLVRLGRLSDCDGLAQMCAALWPESPLEEHRQELARVLSGQSASTMPLTVLVAEIEDGRLVGFLEAGLRSHADGCDVGQPVGFVEGWFVAEDYRRQGVGAQLLAAAEKWARDHGCVEMASDTWIDHEVSQRVHEALGFAVVDRCVHYRKAL